MHPTTFPLKAHRRLSDESDVEPPSYAAALQRRRSTREANRNSHLLPTGEEDQDQRQFPSKKRSTVGADQGKNMSFHRSQMENVEMPDLMGHFQLDPKISNSRSATALMNLRKSYTPSPTGSKDEESEKWVREGDRQTDRQTDKQTDRLDDDDKDEVDEDEDMMKR